MAHRPTRRQRRQMRLLRTVVVALAGLAIVIAIVSRAGQKSHHVSQANRAGVAPASTTPTTLPAHVTVRTLASRLPVTLSRSAVVTINGNVWILGGLTSSGSTTRVLHFDPASATLTAADPLAIGVHDAAAAVLNGSAVVFGGGGERSTVATVQRVQSTGASQVIGRLPQARSDLVAVSVGAHTYVMGGFDGTRATPDVLETDDGIAYRAVAQLAEPVRYPAIAVLGSTIYLFGGQRGTQQTASVQAIDTATGAVHLAGTLPGAVSEASAWVQGGAIYLAGGRHGSTITADIVRFDPAAGTTTPVGALPAPAADAPVALVGEHAYLFGGEGAGRLSTIVEVSADG